MTIAVSHNQVVFFSRPSKRQMFRAVEKLPDFSRKYLSHLFTWDDNHLGFLQLSQYRWEKSTCLGDEIQPFQMGMGQKHVKTQSGIPWCSHQNSFFSLPLFPSPGLVSVVSTWPWREWFTCCQDDGSSGLPLKLWKMMWKLIVTTIGQL